MPTRAYVHSFSATYKTFFLMDVLLLTAWLEPHWPGIKEFFRGPLENKIIADWLAIHCECEHFVSTDLFPVKASHANVYFSPLA